MLLATLPAAPIVVESLPPDLIAWSLSSDAKTAATLGASGELLLWSVDAGGTAHLARRLLTPPWPQGGTGHLDSIAVSPGGRHVVLRRPEGGYAVWSVDPPKVVRAIPGAKGQDFEFGRAAWAPFGDVALVEPAPDHTRLVGLRDGRTLDLSIAPPWTFSPDGKAVVGATPKGLALVDLATGRVRRRFVGPAEILPPYAFSPDGRLLATAAEDPAWTGPGPGPDGDAPTESAYVHPLKIDVWRVADGKLLRNLPGYSSYESDQARLFFLDPRRLAVPRLGQVLDAATGRVVRSFDPQDGIGATLELRPGPDLRPRSVRFPHRPDLGRDIAASPDGRTLATGETGRATRLLVWDLATRRLVRRVAVPSLRNPRALVFRRDGALELQGNPALYDFSAMRDPRVRVALRLSPSEPERIEPSPDLPRGVDAAYPSPDGTFALAVLRSYHDGASHSNLIRYDPRTGERAWTHPEIPNLQGPLALSPDGRRFALAWIDGPLRPGMRTALGVFDAATGDLLAKTLEGEETPYWRSVFSADGKRLFVATGTGLEVRDATKLNLIARNDERQESGDIGLAPLPDGGFAAVRLGRDLRLFNADARLLATLVSFPGSGWAAWTPDGKAWGSPDGLAHLRRPVGDRLLPVGLKDSGDPAQALRRSVPR